MGYHAAPYRTVLRTVVKWSKVQKLSEKLATSIKNKKVNQRPTEKKSSAKPVKPPTLPQNDSSYSDNSSVTPMSLASSDEDFDDLDDEQETANLDTDCQVDDFV